MRIQVKENGVWREVSFEELCELLDAERRATQTAFESEVAAPNSASGGEIRFTQIAPSNAR